MVDCIISHGTLAKGVLDNIYLLQMGSSASMVGRQCRHRHQKDPFVYRGSHPCLGRDPRYYRLVIMAHFAVIPSFLQFCQLSSPCASVNVERVHSGQPSLVLKQSSRDRPLICQYIDRSFPWIQIRNISYPSSPRYLKHLLVRNSICYSFGRIFRLISVPQ
jgi:hypothetical protein